MRAGIAVRHALAALAQAPGHWRFSRDLGVLEGVQRARLGRYLAAAQTTAFGRERGIRPDWSWEDWRRELPVTDYADWQDWVARQRRESGALCPTCHRFEPTSGSQAQRKWIPYPATFLRELDAAAAPWLFDLQRRFPGLRDGVHYWSLSWMPEDLRRERQSSDDLTLLPAWKRALIRPTMAVPPGIAGLATQEEALRQTLVALVARPDLTLISVWSPTFLLGLLDRLAGEREQIAAQLPAARAQLLRRWSGQIEPDFLQALWPRLALISAWDSASSAAWAEQLRGLFPHSPLQGKGLWATEAVVTIPYRGCYPLAYRSHVFEFRCLASGAVLPPWQLRTGQEVQPIVTTASGFWRYALADRLRVTGWLRSVPTLEFLGRIAGTDLVGEKLDAAAVQAVLERLSAHHGCRCLCLLARPGPGRPHYLLLAQGAAGAAAALAAALEAELLQLHHYRLARELGQLDGARACARADALAFYFDHVATAGLAGARKLEPLLAWAGPLPEPG